MQEVKTPVQFTGKAGEYFGIWIVNLLLSIITLGIYSAWAKVRRLKYFYNNTKIDGVGFDYHASPKAILKGRVIAFLVFVLYAVLSEFSPIIGSILLLALFIATPWIIVRGMIFNARNSSHRGLRFDFTGTTGEAAKVFILYPLLMLITLGLAYPFLVQRTNKFIFEKHTFGVSHFQSKALVKDFYKIYLKLFAVLVIIGLVVAIGAKSLFSSLMPTQSLSQSPQQTYVQQTASKQHSNAVFTKNGEFMKVTQGGKTTADGEDDEEAKQPSSPIEEMALAAFAKYGALVLGLFILGPVLIYMLVLFAMAAYVGSRVNNLVWNNTNIEHVGFFSNQRMRDLIWLYFTNTLAVIFTFGLATPWVQIRMANYKAKHLALTGENDWDKFVGEKKESTRALGGEMAEMFDLDISFG